MKIILTAILLLTCSSCSTWQHAAIDISKEPYHIDNNNCVHKATKFISLEGGVVWTVRVHGVGAHRIVYKDGWWVDPTAGTWARELKGITALWAIEDNL